MLHRFKEGFIAWQHQIGEKDLFQFRLLQIDEGDLRLKPRLTDAPGDPLSLCPPSITIARVFPFLPPTPQRLIDPLRFGGKSEGKLFIPKPDFEKDILERAAPVIFSGDPTRTIVRQEFLNLRNGAFDWYLRGIVLHQLLHGVRSRRYSAVCAISCRKFVLAR